MGIGQLPTKTDGTAAGELGRAVIDRPRPLPADPRYDVVAEKFERIKDQVIENATAIGTTTSPAAGSLEARVVTLEGGGGGGNATQLQGEDISATTPTSSQVLAWDGDASEWAPTTLAEAGATPAAVRSEAGAFAIAAADATGFGEAIHCTATSNVAATFNTGLAGQFGVIYVTGTAGAITATSGTATVKLEKGATAVSEASDGSDVVTVSFLYLTTTSVAVSGNLVS